MPRSVSILGVLPRSSDIGRDTDMTSNILVTGGAGYIGSHVCKHLHACGYTPITYDNLERGHRWAVKWGPLEQGSINDEEKLRSIFRRYQPDAVIHLARIIHDVP